MRPSCMPGCGFHQGHCCWWCGSFVLVEMLYFPRVCNKTLLYFIDIVRMYVGWCIVITDEDFKFITPLPIYIHAIYGPKEGLINLQHLVTILTLYLPVEGNKGTGEFLLVGSWEFQMGKSVLYVPLQFR